MLNNIHFVVSPGDLIAGFLVLVVCPCLFIYALIDVYILTPRRKKAESRRRRGDR